MRTTLQRLSYPATRLAAAVLASGSLLTAGCATAAVSGVSPAAFRPQAHADIIYVQAFNASPGQVRLDSGLAQKLKTMAAGESAAGEQIRTAQQARGQVADEIVRQLQSKGLHAVRADGSAPADGNALIVAGDFQTIDAGKRRRRLLVGLGAGKSEVGASVQILYQPANGAPMLLQAFRADADSGHLPGAAETAGVGAAMGRLAMSAAADAGVHAVSEAKRDSIAADATRLADSIADQVVAANAASGWMTPERVN